MENHKTYSNRIYNFINMKTTTLALALLFSFVNAFSQTECNPPTGLTSDVSQFDVKLTWNDPEYVTSKDMVSFPANNISEYSESSPYHNEIQTANRTREYLDVQFSWETFHNNGEAGVACDGEFIYSTAWNDVFIYKYDLAGNFMDTILIPGVDQLRNLVYCDTDGYYYASTVTGNSGVYILDFNTETVVDVIPVPEDQGARALGYDSDLDVFYTNNWDTDIIVIDRVNRAIVDTLTLNSDIISIYGFAYDNVSAGGPYLWGFCQGNSGSELVQFTLPDMTETGIVIDINSLIPEASGGLAGGLFIQEGIVDTTVTLGGLVQNEIIFGLELGNYSPPLPVLAGYNIYRDYIMINTSIVTDTNYFDLGLDAGTYNYYVTAVYEDTDSIIVCESDPSNTVQAIITLPDLVLGGNVFASTSKLDNGSAHAYSILAENLTYEGSSDIDDLGYYFFFPLLEKDYYIYTSIDNESNYINTHISTYYGDVYHWENSSIVHLENNLYNQDINLIELETYNNGLGRISGNIIFEDKSFNIIPANDVLVLLLNDNNKCVSSTISNLQGVYEFSDLGNGTYKILCEIIGKKMSAKTFIITNETPVFDNVNFMVKSDQIILGFDEELPENLSYVSDIYPNPIIDIASIDLVSNEKDQVYLDIVDLQGRLLTSSSVELKPGMNNLSISIDRLETGIKLLKIRFNNNRSITRKFLVF